MAEHQPRLWSTAWAGAEGSRGALVALVALAAVLGLLESATLLALFAFVGRLIPAPGTGTAVQTTAGAAFSGYSTTVLGLAVLAAATLKFALGLLLEWRMSALWTGMRRRMQTRMLALHLNASFGFLLSQKAGAHSYHIIDGPAFAAVFYLHLVRYLATVITLFVLFATLLAISPALMGIAAALAAVYTIAIRAASGRIAFASGRAHADAVRRQTQLAVEGLAGTRYLRVLAQQARWVAEFDADAALAEKAMSRAGFWNTLPSRSFEYLVIVVFLGVALYALASGEAILAILPVVAVYFIGIARMLPTLTLLGNARMQMAQALPNLSAYCELRESIPDESRAGGGAAVPSSIAGRTLAFESVGFAHGSRSVIRELTARLDLGGVTAIVGLSGQGKSTLVDLLLRFVEPASGRLTLDGTDIRGFDLAQWRARFGYLGQEPFLFHASVRENILSGNPRADEARVREAVRQADAVEFVAQLPAGLDTVLADRGQSLSGGQRQRIALARAFVSAADVLVLDEPTTALDAESEGRILGNLIAARGRRGIVLVTHRESLLSAADQVLVIEDGRLVESGRPDALRRGDGHFRRVFTLAS